MALSSVSVKTTLAQKRAKLLRERNRAARTRLERILNESWEVEGDTCHPDHQDDNVVRELLAEFASNLE